MVGFCAVDWDVGGATNAETLVLPLFEYRTDEFEEIGGSVVNSELITAGFGRNQNIMASIANAKMKIGITTFGLILF